jgi:uncharacterized protein (TIGR00369 family)
MNEQQIQAELDSVAAPYVRALGLRVIESTPERTTLHMPVTPALVHGGGVVCGQSVLAAADTAMVVALCAALGGFKPMTTVQLQTSFLRPIPGDVAEVRFVCHVLRRGRTLAFGEIEVFTPDGKLAAHATTTYAFL